MAQLSIKRFSEPDEKRPFANRGFAEILSFEDATVGRARFEPGWRWSNDVKPLAGTQSCQSAHTCFVLSGRMHIVMDSGEEGDVGPGDVVVVAPGHDAWTIGDEPCVMLDFSGLEHYAERREAERSPGQPEERPSP